MVRAVSILVLAASLLACEVGVYSTTGVGVATEPWSSEPSPMPGWSLQGRARDAYAAEVDPEAPRDGHGTIRVHPTADAGGAYATYMTSLDAAPFRGRRAHAVVFVRTQGVTGRGDVWVRAQAAGPPADGPGLATSIARLAANADFTRYELTIDVPDDAAQVQLGVGLGGPGMLWLDGVRVEAQ